MEVKLGQWACVVKDEGKIGRAGEGILFVGDESIQLMREEKVIMKIKYNLLALDLIQKIMLDGVLKVDINVDPYHIYLSPVGAEKETEIEKFLHEITINLARYVQTEDKQTDSGEEEADQDSREAQSPTEPGKPSVVKGFLKKVGKRFKKAAISATGEFIEDKVSELTGNKDLANFTGKLTNNALEELTAEEETGENRSSPQVQNDTETGKVRGAQIPIDIPRRLLGILRVKRSVTIDYIKDILKISREDIIGMIYELVGNGTISGGFDDADTKFTLQIG